MNPKQQAHTTHLVNLTDQFGVWQFFEKGEILKSEGYALDDSSRALIVFLLYNDSDRAKICLDYIKRSLKEGKFIGFWNEKHEGIVYPSSEDAHALAVWALAYCIKNNFEQEEAQSILSQVDLNLLEKSEHIRTRSYALIAHSLLGNKAKAEQIAKTIIAQYNQESQWFEEKLTYANAIIPYALLSYLETIPHTDSDIENIIKEAINTLERYCRIGVIPAPVGNRQWQKIGDISRDIYGQQPIDAAFMVLLLSKAYTYFKDEKYKQAAGEWMEWFYGNNIMKANLINQDYACADWINEGSQNGEVSTNYGSESTIVYLWAQKIFNNLYE